MRREDFRMDRAQALALFARAPVVRIATTAPDGAPILRTVHGVLLGEESDGAGWIAFHGAPNGEKIEAIGRQAVVAAEESIAPLPSYFFDPERACPATTLYLSVQAHGVIEEVDDVVTKARVLSTLMTKFQPEGGHVPIDPEHALYRRAIAGIMVLRVSLERLDGKAKLAQNKRPEERTRLLEQLWRRGDPGDPRAIDLVLRAAPDTPVPSFLRFSDDVTFSVSPTEADAVRAAELLVDVYWNDAVFSRDALVRAHLRSPAWIVARDRTGAVVASARATGDGVKHAWIYDVIVDDRWRAKGLGTRLVALLLEHPGVRGAKFVWLKTRDAQPLYARLGFVEPRTLPPRPYSSCEMVLVRNIGAGSSVSGA